MPFKITACCIKAPPTFYSVTNFKRFHYPYTFSLDNFLLCQRIRPSIYPQKKDAHLPSMEEASFIFMIYFLRNCLFWSSRFDINSITTNGNTFHNIMYFASMNLRNLEEREISVDRNRSDLFARNSNFACY